LQLYGQLCGAGWREPELRRVQTGYELAMVLFASHFRPNHKPFLAHLVGTASILAEHKAGPAQVMAGLLHSAYTHGEFGDGSRTSTPAKRSRVCRVVGPDCEALIAGYAKLPWNLASVAALSANAGGLSAEERSLALIKLADLLEDHLDLGTCYAPNKRMAAPGETDEAWRVAVVQLARSLEQPTLASNLDTALAAAAKGSVHEFLRGRQPGSFVLAPPSHGLRPAVRIGRMLRRWRKVRA
jgi:(p)ppGpp synthase/HD superfamily hydrolase